MSVQIDFFWDDARQTSQRSDIPRVQVDRCRMVLDTVPSEAPQTTPQAPPFSPEGRRLHVIRKINSEQAAVVRRIFEMCVNGIDLTRIAKTFNAEGVQPPRHANGWAPSAIREMLYRSLYKGELVWGQHQKIMRCGTKKLRRRPEAEWLRLEAPELRIVSVETWKAAHARLERARTTFTRSPRDGRLLVGRPAVRDFDSP